MFQGNFQTNKMTNRISIHLIFREEWEWLHTISINNHDESLSPTMEQEFDENGLSLFKTQFQEAARDLCLMLRKI